MIPRGARASVAVAILLGTFAAPAFPAGPGTPAFVVGGGTQVRLAGATRLVLDCDLRNHGQFTPAAGSAVVLRGFGSPLLLGVGTFADLALELAGVAAIANPAAVSGTLTLAQGRLSLAGHDLVAHAVAGGSAASYVMTPDTLGRLVRLVGAGADVNFPVGNATYNPLSLRTGAGGSECRVAVLDDPDLTGLDPWTALRRAWAVSAPGASGPLTLSVQWDKDDQGEGLDRSLGEPGSAWAWRWSDGGWVPRAGVRRTDNGAWPAIDTLVTGEPGLWTLAGVLHRLGAGEPARAPAALELPPAFPNPASGPASVRFGLPAGGRVTLELYSVLGERVVTLADGERAAGWHLVRLDDARLPAGIYFLRLQAGRDVRNRKLVVTR